MKVRVSGICDFESEKVKERELVMWGWWRWGWLVVGEEGEKKWSGWRVEMGGGICGDGRVVFRRYKLRRGSM